MNKKYFIKIRNGKNFPKIPPGNLSSDNDESLDENMFCFLGLVWTRVLGRDYLVSFFIFYF